MSEFDIVIVGGGMVGLSLATALRHKNLRIALIDAASFNTEDKRLIALSETSINFFQHIEIWDALKKYSTPIEQIHVSQQGYFGVTHLHANDIALNALGCVIPAKYINEILLQTIQEVKNITYLPSTVLTNLQQHEDKVIVEIEKNSSREKLTSQYVIGADGTHSTLRSLLNIEIDTHDYNQSALVTETYLQRHHQFIAYERFLKKGALAMLPLSENRAATIWSGPTAFIQELLSLDDETFLQKLQKEFGYRLGRFLGVAKRNSYPLKLIKAKDNDIQNKRVILLGNAIHTLHPIAAQGLNLSLLEIKFLAESLNPTTGFLNFAYSPELKSLQNTSIELSHNLTQVFSTDFFIVNLARQIGLVALDMQKPFKKRFLQRVMGKNLPFTADAKGLL